MLEIGYYFILIMTKKFTGMVGQLGRNLPKARLEIIETNSVRFDRQRGLVRCGFSLLSKGGNHEFYAFLFCR